MSADRSRTTHPTSARCLRYILVCA
jgi:hypothetical protein